MGLTKDITGLQFGKLVAYELVGRYRREGVWLCMCDCGGSVRVKRSNLITGNTQSCGCVKRGRKVE